MHANYKAKYKQLSLVIYTNYDFENVKFYFCKYLVKEDRVQQDGHECSICMESLAEEGEYPGAYGPKQIAVTKCGHMFHANCLGMSVSTARDGQHCPQCRGDLVDNRGNNNFEIRDDIDFSGHEKKDRPHLTPKLRQELTLTRQANQESLKN